MTEQYAAGGQELTLEPDPMQLAIRFSEPSAIKRAKALSRADIGSAALGAELATHDYMSVKLPEALGDPGRLSDVIGKLQAQPEIDRALKVFRFRGRRYLAPNRLVIGIRDGEDLVALLAQHGLTLLSEGVATVRVATPADADVFRVAEAVRETGVRYAEPDLVPLDLNWPLATAAFAGDMSSRGQQNLAAIGAPQAWAAVSGSSNVVVAILDEGVDLTHPDLRATIHGSKYQYDAVQFDDDQTPPSWCNHGTNCAGLAVARPAGASGVKGVGAGCALMSVRVGMRAPDTSDWTSPQSDVAYGIDWAWRNGAAVLSMSFGGAAPQSDILEAVQRALSAGRAGLGSVVIAAAGNSGGPVEFPASIPGVLAVAALDGDDVKVRTSDADWASNQGPEIGIAAPGVGNYTTDISAPGATGKYIVNFNGTSSATPLVAGAAALVLSRTANLTGAEVVRRLQATADKVGANPYQQGRNAKLGYGRLNVARAVT